MYAFDIPKRTQQDLLEEKEYKDYEVNCELNQNGIPSHLLVGHGPELHHFERRDIATTNKLSFGDRQNASQITHSMTYHQENTNLSKYQINTRSEDVPAIFGGLLTSNERKPRGYGEYTKKMDSNHLKLGLRK